MKFTTIIAILISCTFVNFGIAQTQNELVKSAIQEIIKEKVRISNTNQGIHNADKKEIRLRSAREYKLTNNTSSAISEGEPMIAVDVNDPTKMCLSYMRNSDTGLEMPVYYSTDGGDTWSLSDFNIEDALSSHKETEDGFLLGGGDPVLLYDNNHKLYFSWISLTFGLSGVKLATWYATSDDYGKTFSINNDQAFLALGKLESLQSVKLENYGNGILDRQWLAIDRSNGPNRGTIYCSGLHLPRPDANQNIGISILKKSPLSDTFDTKIVVINDQPNLQFANIAVDNQGFLHLVYASTNNEGVYHQVSKDGGNTFSAVHYISSILYLMSGTKNIQMRENPMPIIAIDNTNNQLYVSWTDYTTRNVQAYYSFSKDEGTSWSKKISIGDFINKNGQSIMPALSTNEKGDVSFSWFQIAGSSTAHFYTAVKEKDRPKTHDPMNVTTKATRFLPYLSSQNIFFGDYLNSVMVGCKTFVVFSDGRENKGAKMYLGVTDYCEEISSIYSLTSKNKPFNIVSTYPQPARENITLLIDSKNKEQIEVTWYNMEGKKLNNNALFVLKPDQGEYKVALPSNVISGQILNLQIVSKTYKTARKITIQ